MFLALCSDPKLLAVASRDDRVSRAGVEPFLVAGIAQTGQGSSDDSAPSNALGEKQWAPGSPTVCHRLSGSVDEDTKPWKTNTISRLSQKLARTLRASFLAIPTESSCIRLRAATEGAGGFELASSDLHR